MELMTRKRRLGGCRRSLPTLTGLRGLDKARRYVCGWGCVVAALVSGCEQAHTLRLEVKAEGAGASGLALKVKAAEQGEPSAVTDLAFEGDAFHGELASASDGFYMMYGLDGERQLSAPFYFPDAAKACELTARKEKDCLMLLGGRDNEALSAFNVLAHERGKLFWMEGKDMERERLSKFLKGYGASADSIARLYRPSAPVAGYLELWAYVTAFDNYESLPEGARDSLVFSELFGEPSKAVDTPMAEYFPSVAHLVYHSLPKGSLTNRMDYLFARYQSEPIRRRVGGLLCDDFVRRFDFGRDDFDKGLAELEAVSKKYALDDAHVRNFTRRKKSGKGTPFPEGVTLVDAGGKEVGISDFRGRYVYVDLWASWCAPCVREVPFLQELEKELANKDVVFVSISLDTDEKAWRDKMKALDMHGHQLLNQDNSLAEALKVRGIPFFVIYDKEGRLYMSDAPRPSNPDLKGLLEGLH